MSSIPHLLTVALLLLPGQNAMGSDLTQQPARAASDSDQKQNTPSQTLEPETSPIATVNGVEISLDKFNRLYEASISRLRLRGSGIFPQVAIDIKFAIAVQMIDELLIEQQAKQQDLAVTVNDLDYALQQFGKSFPSTEAFQNYLASLTGGEQALRDLLRVRILKERLAGVTANEPVTDEDARAFYDQNNARFNTPAHLTVQDLVFLVGANANAEFDYAQKAKAEAALEEARKPNVSFGALARQQSQGPRAKEGGDLGQVTQRSIDPVLWNKLSGMQPGQISGVIRAADGYHILRLERLNPEVSQTFEQAKEEIKTSIRARRRSAKLAELISTLRLKAKIENHLVRRYSQTSPERAKPSAGRLEGGIIAPGSLPPILRRGPGPTAVTPSAVP